LAHAEPRRGTVSRRGAGALGRSNVVPVAAVVVNPTAVPSHPRGFARTSLRGEETSREVARTRRSWTGWQRPRCRASFPLLALQSIFPHSWGGNGLRRIGSDLSVWFCCTPAGQFHPHQILWAVRRPLPEPADALCRRGVTELKPLFPAPLVSFARPARPNQATRARRQRIRQATPSTKDTAAKPLDSGTVLVTVINPPVRSASVKGRAAPAIAVYSYSLLRRCS